MALCFTVPIHAWCQFDTMLFLFYGGRGGGGVWCFMFCVRAPFIPNRFPLPQFRQGKELQYVGNPNTGALVALHPEYFPLP